MKTSRNVILACAFLSCLASGAVSTFDFEGSGVPSAFALTGYGGAYSQSLTSTNSYQGAKSLNLSLTDTGASQWATTTIVLSETLQHVTFALYDQYASNSPVYYYFFLEDTHDTPRTTLYGLDYADGGFGYPKSTSVLMFGANTIPDYTRTVGWHVIDASITSNSIEYKIDGNLLGVVATDPLIHVDSVGFGIANAGRGGTNSLLIDNLSITTIPEPSSLLLGCLALVGLASRRNRRR
jgi:hypothetical protein